MSELESLNERLDKQACEMLECYEELLTERSLLEKCLDDGYLNMSKARSIVGCASLSRLQIPEEDLGESRFKVNIKDEDQFELVVDQNQPLHPPKWAGSFPSMSLKASQKAFARSLPLLVSIAHLQAKLTSMELAYKGLLKEKQKIVDNDVVKVNEE